MAISGNKGEWSEIYTLFKLLADGKVHAGDADMNQMSLYFPILCVIREESKRYEYKPDVEKSIVVIDENGTEYARIPMNSFKEESTQLLTDIKEGSRRTFEIPRAEAFMNRIGCSRLKAPSSDKADIHIVIHDMRTCMNQELGFSIKSQLGSASTLLNSGTSTNITYKVSKYALNDHEIEEINAIPSHISRMKAIIDKGCSLDYHDIEHPTFKNNLLFMDCCMPRFIADCLLVDSKPDFSSSVKECVAEIAKQNPFNYSGSNIEDFYAHKMKALLLDTALGMTPAKEWNGRYEANGGYLVVRKDGEIVCYHFYNRNDVEDYLYNNTRFDRASRKRYDYGYLYRGEDGNAYIKLNLQIRFKN